MPKMELGYLCIVLAACFAVCYSRDINVNSSAELKRAIENALPGDRVTVSPGIYQTDDINGVSFFNIVGTSDKQIYFVCPSFLCQFQHLVVGSSSYLAITGFSVINNHLDFEAVYIDTCDHVGLYNFDISGGKNQNVWILRSSNSVMDSCTFQGSENALSVEDSSDYTIKYCTVRNGSQKNAFFIRNTTRSVFTDNEFACETLNKGGSWIVEYDAGGNTFANNNFGFVFMRYKQTLNGYLAYGSCLYGPSTMMNNYMDLQSGVGFAGCKDYKNKVCASNVVAGGAQFTDGDVDQSC